MIGNDSFTVDASVAALLPREEAVKVAPKLDCKTCQGRGVYNSYPLDGQGPALEFECYTCDGRGWI